MNMKMLDVEDVKWVEDNMEDIKKISAQLEKVEAPKIKEKVAEAPKQGGALAKMKAFVRKAVDCCIE